MRPPRSPLEDRALPHQVRLGLEKRSHRLTVGCNCLPRGQYLSVKQVFASGEALEIYTEHLREAGVDLCEEPAERVARAFHEAYEALAPGFGYRTREASAVPWAGVPEKNRMLMAATAQKLLDDGVIACAEP